MIDMPSLADPVPAATFAAMLRRAVPGFLRPAARRTLNGLDRAAHPLRRRRALRSLQDVDSECLVVFLCWGNICRSPYAAESFARMVGTGNGAPVIASAGFFEADRPSPPNAVAAARAAGIDLTQHRSRRVDDALAASADVVVVMEAAQRARFRNEFRGSKAVVILLGDIEAAPGATRTILDPIDKPLDFFHETYRRIDAALHALRDALPRGRGAGTVTGTGTGALS